MNLTAQEIFDKVATHLFSQGEQSLLPDEIDICAYRGKNGLMCAMGILIPDNEYKPELEQKTVIDLANLPSDEYPVTVSLVQRHNNLLNLLQIAHDISSNWDTEDTLRKKLTRVALVYELDYSVLKDLKFKS